MKINKRSAFTLAEALLTITIIGVVMSMMVRSINRISPDKEKILFIKTYHAIEHVIADTINDPSKYDQNYYTDVEIEDMESEDLHIDFRFNPLKTAKAVVNGETIYSCEHEKAKPGRCINKENAMCYFIADGLNTVGEVNCEIASSGGINMKTSTGVYLRNLYGINDGDPTMPDGSNDPVIQPIDDGDMYVYIIYADGKLTVPEKYRDANINQTKAHDWMKDQTQVK